MAKYSVIADIGKGILNMLRDKLVPEPVDKAESIGICEPRNRGGYVVGIHPYDIKEDANGKQTEPKTLPDGSIQDPPAMMEIYYMVSVSSKAEMETKALDEARIIGKIIQVFKDNANIPNKYMPDNCDYPRENAPISMLPLDMEEKVKVWTMFGESYKLSVFYVVGPIAIDSEIIRKPRRRVETVVINSSQFIPKKIIQFETRIKDEEIDDEYTQHDEEEDEDSGDDSDDSSDDSGDDYGDDSEDSGDDSSDDSGDSGDSSDSSDDSGDSGDSSDDSGDSGDSGDDSGDSGDSSDDSGDSGDSSDDSGDSGDSSDDSGDSGDSSDDSGDSGDSSDDSGDSGDSSDDSGDSGDSSDDSGDSGDDSKGSP